MKENIMDVLLYLFEHYVDEDTNLSSDQETLRVELSQAGFANQKITKAFEWLEGLAETQTQQRMSVNTVVGTMPPLRIYTEAESSKLDTECRGFLLFLEQIGVLDSHNRELIIDRSMALESDDFALEQLKWVVLMVLFNQPDKEDVYQWIEDLLYEEMTGNLH